MHFLQAVLLFLATSSSGVLPAVLLLKFDGRQRVLAVRKVFDKVDELDRNSI